MTIENPIEEPIVEPTKEEQLAGELASANARIEELYAQNTKLRESAQASAAQRATDVSTMEGQARQLSELAQAFNALKTQAEAGSKTLQQIGALAMGGVDIVGVVGEVESALGRIKSAMASTSVK